MKTNKMLKDLITLINNLQQHLDNGDIDVHQFYESVISERDYIQSNWHTEDEINDDLNDLSIEIVDNLVEMNYVPNCTDTDNEDEFIVQDMIKDKLLNYLTK